MRFAGIDAGSKTYDVFWFDDSLESGESGWITVSSVKVKDNPEVLLKVLEDVNADFYAGLSGYGLPVKHFSEIEDREFKLMTLSFEEESSLGLRKILKILSKSELEIYTIPAVIHLKTVPEYRKFCKIDMGTYDKLCTAIFSLLKSETHVVVEAGYGYTSFLAVEEGKIVDGIGGTSGFPSYGSIGCMDAELAYLLAGFKKKLINYGLKTLETETENWKAGMAENLVKGVRAIEVSISDSYCFHSYSSPRKVFLSGRVFEGEGKFAEVRRMVVKTLESFGYKWEVLEPANASSAIGAAIVANGIGGGKYKDIVKKAGVFEAEGSVIDYLPEKIKEIVEKRLC